jgi:cytochrome P450/NADPH-cytochrome P450 reductase
MKDIANQLVLKWARNGPSTQILATDDFTRLTLDTIALCTMAYRFNSFYSSDMHPFVDAMMNILLENGARTRRPNFVTAMRYGANEKFRQDAALLTKTGKDIIEDRRTHPTEKPDLLNAMLHGVDPKTKEAMRDELIVEEMTTFLIAGGISSFSC